MIEAVSFVDSEGGSEVKFRERDFGGSETKLLRYIMGKLLEYNWSIGWNSQGNSETAGSGVFDLSILHKRCKANRINCIVELRNKGLPYLINDEHRHIDLHNIYSKEMVRNGMYHNAYRTNKLDDVSKTLLGYGKYGDYSGEQFASLPIEDQVKYSLRDSELPMQLSKYKNFEVLDSMLAIAEITKLDFERVCRTNISTWWAAIFERDGLKPLEIDFNEEYKGADVLFPKKGLYNNIVVVDAQSLYPSVGIKYNISSDSINRPCCKHDLKARICNLIPDEFTKDCNNINPKIDWICQHEAGAFPTKLKIYKTERLRHKALGNKATAQALKILINGGYGVFGYKGYTYYDPRIAELITAAGRCELANMQYVANHEYGFEIIYGDTDSLFLNNTTGKDLKAYQDNFKAKHDIELEIKNRYDKLLLSAGKKHYIGYENGVIDSVGYEGEKSNNPEFFHKVYGQLIDEIIKQEINPLPNLRKSISDLNSKQVNPESLKIFKKLSMELSEYAHEEGKEPTAQIYKIGKALGAKKGDLVGYFSANVDKTGKSWTTDFADADIPHYKDLLWNTIYEILDIAGYPIKELALEFGINIDDKGKAKEKPKRKSRPKVARKSKSKPKPEGKKRRIIKSHDIGSLTNTNMGGEMK